MELKEGMYVRTKEGLIDKVIIDYKGCCNCINCNCINCNCDKNNYIDDIKSIVTKEQFASVKYEVKYEEV